MVKSFPADAKSMVYAGGGAKGLAHSAVQLGGFFTSQGAAPSMSDYTVFGGASIGALFALIGAMFSGSKVKDTDQLKIYKNAIIFPMLNNWISSIVAPPYGIANTDKLFNGLPKLEGLDSVNYYRLSLTRNIAGKNYLNYHPLPLGDIKEDHFKPIGTAGGTKRVTVLFGTPQLDAHSSFLDPTDPRQVGVRFTKHDLENSNAKLGFFKGLTSQGIHAKISEDSEELLKIARLWTLKGTLLKKYTISDAGKKSLSENFGILPGFGYLHFIKQLMRFLLILLYKYDLKKSEKEEMHRGITFKQFRKITGRGLVVVGYNLSNNRLVPFSDTTTPDMYVAEAIRISGSFPYVFRPVHISEKEAKQILGSGASEEAVRDLTGMFIDGGTSDNAPRSSVIDCYPEISAKNMRVHVFAPRRSTHPTQLTLGGRDGFSENFVFQHFTQRFAEADEASIGAIGNAGDVYAVDTLQTINISKAGKSVKKNVEIGTFTFDIKSVFSGSTIIQRETNFIKYAGEVSRNLVKLN